MLPTFFSLPIPQKPIQHRNASPNKAHQQTTQFNPGLKKDAVHFGSSLQTDFAQGGHAMKAGGELPGLRGGSNHVLPLLYFSARQSPKKLDPAASTLRAWAKQAKNRGDEKEANRLYGLAKAKRRSQAPTGRRRAKKDTPETELAVSTLFAWGKKAQEEGNFEKANRLYGLANAKRRSQAQKGVNATPPETGPLPAFFQANQWPNQLPVEGYGSTYQGQPPSGGSRSHNTGSQLDESNPFDLRGILENLDPDIAEELNAHLQIDDRNERLQIDALLREIPLNTFEQAHETSLGFQDPTRLPAFQGNDNQGRAGFTHLNLNDPFRESLTDQMTPPSQEDLSTAQRPETPVNKWSERTFEIDGILARNFRHPDRRVAYNEEGRKRGFSEIVG